MSNEVPRGMYAARAMLKAMTPAGKTTPKLEVRRHAQPHYDPNDHTVVLPGVPATGLPEEAMTALRAYLDHELAESQESTWSERIGNVPDGHRRLVNCLNDARIDEWQADRYPGSGLNIRRQLQADYEAMKAGYEDGQVQPSVANVAALARYVGEGIIDVDQIKRDFPDFDGHIERVEDELRNLDISTEDACMDTAERMYKLLKEQPPQQQPQPQEGEGESQEDGDGESEEGAESQGEPSDGDSDQPEGETGDGDSEDDGDQGGDANAGESEGSEDEGEGSEGDTPTDAPDSPQMDADAGEGEVAEGESGQPRPTQGEGQGEDKVEEVEALPDTTPGDWDPEQNMKDKVASALTDGSTYTLHDDAVDPRIVDPPSHQNDTLVDRTPAKQNEYDRLGSTLAVRIRRAMEAPQQAYARNKSRGTPDPTKLHQLAAGMSNVMRRRVQRQENNVAVALSVDLSGSMNSPADPAEVMRLNAEASKAEGVEERGAVCDKMRALDTRTEVVYDLSMIWNVAMAKLDVALGIFGWYSMRIGGKEPVHFNFKHMDDTPTSPDTLYRLACMHTGGYTPLAAGIEHALLQLEGRHERKKILVVLTDGQVRDGRRKYVEYIKSLHEEAKRQGVTIVGIGIGSEAQDQAGAFETFLPIEDADHFVNKVSTQLVKAIKDAS